jgi:hypothetical protein
MVFEDTQPAIIDQSTWDIVSRMRQNKRRPMKYGLQGLFMSVAFCADCGSKLYFHTAKRNSKLKGEELIGSYSCSNYRKVPKKCTAHYITETALEEIITYHLRLIISLAVTNEKQFAQRLMDNSRKEADRRLAEQKKTLIKYNKRIQEIDTLFERLYEDNINSRITNDRFDKMSAKFEQEQADLKTKAATLETEITTQQSQAQNIDKFISLAKETINIQTLTTSIVNTFIKQIIIHNPNNPRSKDRHQQIDIIYNFVGPFEMDDSKEKESTDLAGLTEPKTASVKKLITTVLENADIADIAAISEIPKLPKPTKTTKATKATTKPNTKTTDSDKTTEMDKPA